MLHAPLDNIPNDIQMVVGILEKADFTVSQGNKVLEETFDGHGMALQGTHADDRAMRTVTWF